MPQDMSRRVVHGLRLPNEPRVPVYLTMKAIPHISKLGLLTSLLASLTVMAQEQSCLLKLADFGASELSQLGMQKAQEDSITIVTSPCELANIPQELYCAPVIPR